MDKYIPKQVNIKTGPMYPQFFSWHSGIINKVMYPRMQKIFAIIKDMVLFPYLSVIIPITG